MKVINLFTKEILHSSPDAPTMVESNVLTNLIHIEGGTEQQKVRLAMQIHETISSWTFAKYDSIKDSLRNLDDLDRCGNMVILVEELTEVSPQHMQLFCQYIENTPLCREYPTIITTSNKSLTELLATEKSELQSFLKVVNQNVFNFQDYSKEKMEDLFCLNVSE